MKKTLLLIFILLMLSCQKDGVFPKSPPNVKLEVQWIPPRTFILTGETNEPSDRGFIISSKQGSIIGEKDIVVLPYDIQGIGKFTKEITLSGPAKVYIRAWAMRRNLDNVGYSNEVSFDAW